MCGGSKKQESSYKSAAAPQLQSLISRATDVSNNPYNPNTEMQVADFTPQQQAAFGLTDASMGAWQPFLQQSQQYAQQGAAPITTAQIQQYQQQMDPVIQAVQSDFDVQNARQLQQVGSNSAMKGALGNSGAAVAKSLAQEQQNRTQAPILANLRLNTALDAAQKDRQAAQYGAGAFSNLGAQTQGQGFADIAQLYGMGSNQQAQQQNVLNAASGNAAAQSAYPFQTTQWLASLLNPTAATMGGTQTTPGPSIWNQILGLGATGLGAYMASDERIKHDVKPVGETFDGLPIYTFKMPGSDAAQMGVMAQDVELRDPEAVADIGGIKHVNYDRVADGAIEPYNDGGVVDKDVSRLTSNLRHAVETIKPFRSPKQKMADGGTPIMPYAGARSYVPVLPVMGASPKRPEASSQQNDAMSPAMAKAAQSFGSWMATPSPTPTLTGWATSVFPGFDRGGRVEAFADGGVPWVDGQPQFEPVQSEALMPSYVGLNPSSAMAESAPAQAEPEKKSWWQYGSNPGIGQALMAAGLATMASRSPWVGTAIGEGGLAGLGNWSQQQEAARRDRAMKLEEERRKAAEAHQAAQLGLQRDTLAETRRYHDTTAELQRDQFNRQMVPEVVRQVEAMGYPRGTPQHAAMVQRILTKDRTETAFDQNIAKASAGDYEKRAEAVRDSQGKLQQIGQLESLISNPAVYQGAGAEYVLQAKKLAQAAGFNVEGVPDAETMRAISNQFALKLRSTAGGEGMPGALSDQDRNFLLASVPGLTQTPLGNAALARMMREAEEYKVRANTEAMKYIQSNKSNVGLGEYMTGWMGQNPMISRQTRAQAQEAINSIPPADPVKNKNTARLSAADYASQPVGTRQTKLINGRNVTLELRQDGKWHPVEDPVPSIGDVVAP